jgi:hypothetical protein
MADAESLVTRILGLVVSAGAGAAVTLVAFRTRLALADRRVETLESHIDERLDLISRRQMLTLEIVADLARKEGIDNRFSDAIVRFLAEESNMPRAGGGKRAD